MKKLVRKYAVAAVMAVIWVVLGILQPFQGGKPAIGDKLNDLRKSTIGR